MGLFFPSRRSQPRRFDYEPRFYDPRKDDSLKRRMRIESRSARHRRPRSGIIYFGVLLAAALYLYHLVA